MFPAGGSVVRYAHCAMRLILPGRHSRERIACRGAAMFHAIRIWVFIACCALCCANAMAASSLLEEKPDGRSFPLVSGGRAADIVVDPADHAVVRIAAQDLADDIARVTGIRPAIKSPGSELAEYAVLIGVVDNSLALEGIPAEKSVRGKWESFLISVTDAPRPGVKRALVIAGSDRRGAAFGVYELSREIGVSPWVWWADVAPQHRDNLFIRNGSALYGPPSVKYRGIFINDEKFGLHPWAANTFEPENGGIGPKTYEKVFELLLRLKGNYLWPAMKQCTRAFNAFDANARLAHDYAIVMGSSHCEHLLRNNIDEWPRDGKGEWDYTINRGNILEYWAARLKTNGGYENIYTLGMRGADDKEMPGGGTLDEQTARLSQIIRDQRELLKKFVNPGIQTVPQILSPYKEVLDLYRNGLDLPEDVTILWTDDNYGYIRKLPNETERNRSGGHGVYYHISYSGNPHDYLWLNTTPPALMWYELKKAYDHGARTVWVLNAGDIKPMETGIDYFMRLAWDMDSNAAPLDSWELLKASWNPLKAMDLAAESELSGWNDRQWLLPLQAFALAAIRKPELMGYNERDFPKTKIQDPDFSLWNYGDEASDRIEAYKQLEAGAAALYDAMPDEDKAAFYQLYLYPIRGASLMNQKILYAYKSREYAKFGRTSANRYAELSGQAFEKIKAETEYYNKTLSGGKWDGVMDWRHHDRLVFHGMETGSVKPRPGQDFMVMIEGQDKPTPPADVSTDNPRNALPELTCIKNRDGYDKVFIDLFTRGTDPVDWTLASDAAWLKASSAGGSLTEEIRLQISIDCRNAPTGRRNQTLTIAGGDRTYKITVPVFVPQQMPEQDSFVQKNGLIAIPASLFDKKGLGDSAPHWESVMGLGRSFGAIALFPTTMEPVRDPAKITSDAPAAHYRLHVYKPGKARLILQALPTHEITENHRLVAAVSVDGGKPVIVEFEQGNDEHNEAWRRNALRNYMEGAVEMEFSEGPHSLVLYGMDPSVAVDRILIDFGGLKPCNYGPHSTRYDDRDY